jgi:malonyl-CoA O-methyltransferase
LQIHTARQLMAAIRSWKISSMNILDLGCGTGLATQMLAETNPHHLLMGIDMADDLLKIARARLGENIPVFCGDFDRIPAKAQQFDLVFSNMALQWSLDFTITIEEISRVMQQNGYLAFSLPVDGTFAQIKKLLYQLTGERYLNEFMPISQISQTLESHGYEIIDNQIQEYNLSFLNLNAAFNSIKKVGALINNAIVPLAKSLYRKSFHQGVILDYQIATIVAKRKPSNSR